MPESRARHMRAIKRMLRRPLTAVKGATVGKQEDPQWLKWVKRASTVAVAVASAIAALTAAIIIVCWV